MSESNDLRCFSEAYQMKVRNDQMFNDMSDSKQIRVLKASIDNMRVTIQELQVLIRELTEDKS
jgi:hypothetical protein